MITGNLYEIFSGIQGEGLFVGERQAFIRFSGCNLNCDYCDTALAKLPSESCRVEKTSGFRDFFSVLNPVSSEDVIDWTKRILPSGKGKRAAAITGGEPLLQKEFLKTVLSGLKDSNCWTMIETNGTLPEALAGILPLIDMISMDIKLSGAGMGPKLLQLHEHFLSKAVSTGVYVKIVLTSDIQKSELFEAVQIIESVDYEIPLVLQPVTPIREIKPPNPSQVLELQALCLKHLKDVRVIPQCHKMLGQL